MTFVNEYVSEDDIKKYNLEDVKLRYNPQMKAKGIPSHFRFYWVIDREQDVYLMKVKTGRDSINNRVVWVLYFKGYEFKVQTDRSEEGSLNINDTPYRIVWELVNIKPDEIREIQKKYLLNSLKSALEVFGEDGVVMQIKNTKVEFKF